MTDQHHKRELANTQALNDPQPGDYWQEMFCPYFVVVNVEGNQYRVLSCLGGPNSFTRKDEINARIELDDGWTFDLSKSMLVSHEWIKKAVCYDNIGGFVADVVRSEKTLQIAQEWRDWRQKQMRQQIDQLTQEWETFTGWTALKTHEKDLL